MSTVPIPAASGKAMKTIDLVPHERYERKRLRADSDCPELWNLLDQVKDPEIPVLSLWDLGILQNVEQCGDQVRVTITPTYSGCPAMDVIREDIEKLLRDHGVDDVSIKTQLSPAWTTDWMTEEGRAQLQGYGIAPPGDVSCPHCGSKNTNRVSEFGSTACKALYQCGDCGEPFDYFKNI